MHNEITLEITPQVQLSRVEENGEVHWHASGNHGSFACTSSAFPIKGGWYRLDLSLKRRNGSLACPAFFADYGFGVTVGNRVPLPFLEQGADHCVVRFTGDVIGLRLDPSVSACEFEMSSPRLKRLSRTQALVALLRGGLARSEGKWLKIRLILAAVKKFVVGDISALAQRLYDAYLGVQVQIEATSSSYTEWLRLYGQLDVAANLQEGISRPLISILVPVYNTEEKWLRSCIDSVLAQKYDHWELCIADDASPDAHVRKVLDDYALRDPRIRVKYREVNGHICAASNSALEMARGSFVALLDHDDALHPMALQTVVNAIGAHPEWRMMYSDEDKIDTNGRRYDPYFKPDFSYDLLLGQNVICHLSVYETSLLRSVGGFRLGFEGSQDWDLSLRCVEQLSPSQIGHIPAVLYHWRAVPGSTALAADQKDYAQGAGYRAVLSHLERVSPGASLEALDRLPGYHRVRYPLPTPMPKVGLIIPTHDALPLLKMSVGSILEKTAYDNFEILIIDNRSVKSETLEYFSDIVNDPRVRVLPYPYPFNYSAINNFAAANTDADILGLINNDIEVISEDWLREMASHAWREDIGCVGAMLYYPDDKVQHAGVVTGIGGVAGHVHLRAPRGAAGDFSRMALVQNYSCVTAACLLVRRSVFEEVGGLEERLQVAFNDVDFCLRVREAGYRNLWTPFAELYHHESASRGYEDTPEKVARFQGEIRFMRERWGNSLDYDPAYNPNLSLITEAFALAFPPREFMPSTGVQSNSARG